VNVKKLKASVTEEVEARRQQLRDLSLKIHSSPELGFKEVKAAGWLSQASHRHSG
jgi:metal-dependent amidase/aminoacylase/carboxypeptidase family protein